MALPTGVVRHEIYKRHLLNYAHVESPQRLQVIYRMLDEADMGEKLLTIEPRPATHEELGWVHSETLVRRVAATEGKPHTALDPDTQTTPQSYAAARMAAGGLFCLIDKIFDGTVRHGFALVRPPGHHAEENRAMGFCLFNNVALGALYAGHTYGAKRILIVDWDLHHGNATQNSFYGDSSVLYFSTHQFPHYPGSGSLNEVGYGGAKGFTVNVPLYAGHGDQDFFQIFKQILSPIAAAFQPELILVSAGFDTYVDDPLGGMHVTPKGYGALTRILMDLAEEHCSGRLALTLEGGYHLAGLSESVRAVLKELVGESLLTESEFDALNQASPPPVVKAVIETHKAYWPSLQRGA